VRFGEEVNSFEEGIAAKHPIIFAAGGNDGGVIADAEAKRGATAGMLLCRAVAKPPRNPFDQFTFPVHTELSYSCFALP
jgi:hypothetical protein